AVSTATVVWTTDEPADSQVEYGPTTAYGTTTTLDPSRTTSHAVPISGLTPGTYYHYRVKSRDAAGNLATSADFFLCRPTTDKIAFNANRNTANIYDIYVMNPDGSAQTRLTPFTPPQNTGHPNWSPDSCRL